MEQLEQIDENLLQIILECPSSAPKEMLYLEVGATPIRYILMSGQLIFYHYLIRQPAESLIHSFYQTQLSNPVKNDWCVTIQSNLDSLNHNKSEIKNLVNKAVKKRSL